jgi:hypothetical protein
LMPVAFFATGFFLLLILRLWGVFGAAGASATQSDRIQSNLIQSNPTQPNPTHPSSSTR